MRRDLIIIACAISAGIHAALVPEHLEESAAAGGGFIAAAIVLAALVVALTIRPDSRPVTIASAATLTGLLVSYALATTTGMPVLMPEAEPVDAFALTTKAVELLGLAAALIPFQKRQRRGASAWPRALHTARSHSR